MIFNFNAAEVFRVAIKIEENPTANSAPDNYRTLSGFGAGLYFQHEVFGGTAMVAWPLEGGEATSDVEWTTPAIWGRISMSFIIVTRKGKEVYVASQ